MDDKTLLQLLQSNAEAGIKAALDLYGGGVETICKNFLINLPEQDLEEAMKEPDRTIFILRYFYLEPIAKIAARTGCTSGKVKNILCRGKSKLEAALKERGISNE